MDSDTDPRDGEPTDRAATGSPARERRSDGARSGRRVTFTVEGARRGFLTCAPIAVGVGGFGIAFGVLARQAGLSAAEATLMSATVFAGASQLVAIELWADPIPIATIVLATLAINLRYSLMGAALGPWFARLPAKRAYASLCFMIDENWALTTSEFRSRIARDGPDAGREPVTVDAAFLLGSGLVLWIFWVSATAVGAIAGGAFGEPERYGLDFVLTAVFVALAVELWEGRSSAVPWLTALVTAIVAARFLPGQWYILLGGFAAAVVEVIRHDG